MKGRGGEGGGGKCRCAEELSCGPLALVRLFELAREQI